MHIKTHYTPTTTHPTTNKHKAYAWWYGVMILWVDNRGRCPVKNGEDVYVIIMYFTASVRALNTTRGHFWCPGCVKHFELHTANLASYRNPTQLWKLSSGTLQPKNIQHCYHAEQFYGPPATLHQA